MSLSVQFRSRAWPRVAILALVAVAAAGCSDSARFGSNRSEYYQPPKKAEVTGSIAKRPATSSQRGRAAAAGAEQARDRRRLSRRRRQWRAGPRRLSAGDAAGDITGSVPAQPAGHWTWDGGKAVAVERGRDARVHRPQAPRAGVGDHAGQQHPQRARPQAGPAHRDPALGVESSVPRRRRAAAGRARAASAGAAQRRQCARRPRAATR